MTSAATLDVHTNLVPCLEKVMGVQEAVAKNERREGGDGKEVGEPTVTTPNHHS